MIKSERWLEWLKASLSKSDVRESAPWVQIPLSPPILQFRPFSHKSLKHWGFNRKVNQYDIGAYEVGNVVQYSGVTVEGVE